MNAINQRYSKQEPKLFLKWLGFGLVAFCFVFIGQDNDFWQLVRMPTFYSDFLLAFLLAATCNLYIKWLNKHLDIHFSWTHSFKPRFIRQVVFGVVVPVFIGILIEILYLFAVDAVISFSAILHLEFPLAALFVIIINLLQLLADAVAFRAGNDHTISSVQTVDPMLSIPVRSGSKELLLEPTACAYFYSSNKIVWVQTFSGEKYRVAGTLDFWETKLVAVHYYRINRQYLVSRAAVLAVELTETRRLKVSLCSDPGEEVYISKSNIARFKLWWKGDGPV